MSQIAQAMDVRSIVSLSDARQVEIYFVHFHRVRGVYVVLYCYLDDSQCACIDIHRGCRTGKPVTFSRLSDAERLCGVLNGRIGKGV